MTRLLELRESTGRIGALLKRAMRLAIGIVTLLLVVAVLLAVPLVAHRAPAAPDCVSRVVTLKGPGGAPVECVCIGGTLSTCFNPGP